MLEKYFKMVEQVLQSFPDECQKNYYENKKTLRIEDKTNEEFIIKSTSALYDEHNNLITLYDSESVIHELFHMSFRNKENLTKKLFEDEEIYYSNGIAYKIVQDESFSGKALTEGFVEYLTRKISNQKGHSFEYFIADLLISIYGENIIEYPLKNDVYGFYTDERFYNIFRLKNLLNQYYSCVEVIHLFNYTVIPMIEKVPKEESKELFTILDKNITDFYNILLGVIEAIIDEYKNCSNPLIDRDNFIFKLKDFITNPDYIVNFEFVKLKNYDIEKELKKIIKAI